MAASLSVLLSRWTRNFFYRYGGTMPRLKQASKRKHMTIAAPALGAAGLTLSLVGGASAAVAAGSRTAADAELYTESCRSPSVKKKSPMSAWRPSTYSTRKALQLPRTAYSWPAVAVAVAVAAVAAVAVVAAAEVAVVVAVAVAAVSPGAVAVFAKHDTPTYLINASGHGRVRQDRPGQSMSRLLARSLTHAWRDGKCKYWPNGSTTFRKCQRASWV